MCEIFISFYYKYIEFLYKKYDYYENDIKLLKSLLIYEGKKIFDKYFFKFFVFD